MQNSFDFKDKYPYKAGHRKVRTSVKAADDINKQLGRLHKMVLLELEKVYPKGLTTSELANRCINISMPCFVWIFIFKIKTILHYSPFLLASAGTLHLLCV